MGLRIIFHARERMRKYEISQTDLEDCVKKPELLIPGKFGRTIAQKRINGYVLRVIYEKTPNTIIVVTTYKAKRDRYEI